MNNAKTIITALAIVAGAVFATQAVAKKKQADKAQPQPTVQLNNGIDSLSYAAGEALTDGLIPFIQQQHHVDTAYMEDFVQGMREAIEQAGNPRYVARQVGAQIAQMAKDRMLTGLNNDLQGTPDSIKANLFYEGFIAAVQKDSTLMSQKAADAYFKARMEADSKIKTEKLAAEGKAWLAENAKKPGVVTLPSGLQYKVITEGKGAKPTAEQEVTVKYEGKLIDGKVFDSSYKRNPQTTKFRCNQVIKGWTEALTLMPVGSKWELYIPQELGYGSRDMGNIPAYSTLIFTVELVDITK
ncbi:MAG: FKBP-type peptidyl-prolyl cis-trans isomerase [Prevotella sp.]|nr:FKBP-type peptidyl-prolyl cis-trans isomerase [Prevotella sp.]MBR1839919.1 FKBP-type peptidyl-prolyl cis-trans isomerase [Prevotella sp.]